MKTKLLLIVFCALCLCAASYGQQGNDEKTFTFRFVVGDDMFYIPWSGNALQLKALYDVVERYRSEIVSGKMPVYVDGYSSSRHSRDGNLGLAFVRANRVKSELITHKGLVEDNFITKNYTTAYTGADGVRHTDMVVVTLRIPVRVEPRGETVTERPRREEPAVEAVKEEPRRQEPVVAQEQEQAVAAPPATDPWKHPYRFAVRTNLLYDALLVPTLGLEWRVSRNVGIKLDGGLSRWGGNTGKVQKIWFQNPEVRRYMGATKRFYLGVGGNYAKYNAYGYLLGKLWPDDTGYQGKLWNAGLTAGYQVPLSRSFALDFNIGLGYTKLEYDSFWMQNDTRVYKAKDKSKNFWGPTQAGINLIWTIGGNR